MDQISITQYAGITLGAIMLLAVVWVWIRKQVFGLGGVGMSAAGMVLVSLTLWQNIVLKNDGSGFRLELNRLIERVEQSEAALAEAKEDVRDVTLVANNYRVELDKLNRIQLSQSTNIQRLKRELRATGSIRDSFEIPAHQMLQEHVQPLVNPGQGVN